MPEIDHEGLAETLREINDAMAETVERVRQLSTAVVEGRSEDERVRVRVTDGWRTIKVRLREDIFHRYELDALSDVVTRTVREAQQRARAAFEQAVEQIGPVEFIATEHGPRRQPNS
jgi:DNA-binding protein YbaB